ncbi:hypothetical protein MOQ_004337 [Trypanosoma cruzi marinkellei]|uniref:FPL domain-containing protein n=1 Tax=Trypanosoma cruzi marinkellei TaxID=85056 RepID=K2NAB1_TRYCR|nr:hypothetical protein MOQ_004337 [Trypanosoma cruzi marinkellei]
MEESQVFYPGAFVEALRELTEVLIWSDKNAESVFDNFLERSMMSTLERVVTNAEFPSAVKVQAIQCITMMLQNLTRKSSIYFVCSNNHLNRIISIFIDDNDEELFSIYVSFLRSLALRLNEDTVQFFFERETRAFPLFDRASKLLAAPDPMVRAAARQVVISVAQLNEPAIKNFLRDALQEVFRLISTLLWSQIKSLAEAAAEYGNVERHDANELHLMSISTLSARLEDIVDDMFYINDLFLVPHDFAPFCLECVLEEVVIQPLLMLLENLPCDLCCFSTNRSFTPCVSASVALSVLTRWILLNKSERLQRLFKEGLLNSSASHGGVMERLLKSECAEVLSGVVVLLKAMLTSGLLENENKLGGNCPTTDGNETDNEGTLEEALDEKEMDVVTDFFNENWSIEPEHEDSFPPLQPLSIIPCEIFVGRMSQQVENAVRSPWFHGLMSALYFFITRPAYTRFSVFEMALSVLMDFVKCRRERVVLFRGLLFLCLFIVRRRAVTCAESSALRQDGNVNSASTPAAVASTISNSVATTTTTDNKNNKSAGAWLRTPYEVVFIKLEHVSHEFGLREEKLHGNLSNEASFLLPLLPNLEFIRSERERGSNIPHVNCWDVVLRNFQGYTAVQKSVATVVPLRNRAAHDQSEEERSEFLMWLTIRHYAHKMLNREDGFLLRLRDYGVRHHVGTTVSLSQSNKMYFRCEFVKGRFLFGASSPRVAAGTAMCMLLSETEVLFLGAGDALRPVTDRGVTLCVIFALQMIYVQALVSQSPFSVIVTHVHPASPLQLHIVFRHRKAAASAVNMITELSSLCRFSGAALVCRALNQYRALHMMDEEVSKAPMNSFNNA